MAGNAPPGVEFTTTLEAVPVHCSVWLCDSSRSSQDFYSLICFDLQCLFKSGRFKLILDVDVRTQVDQQLNSVCVILYSQIVQCRLPEARAKVEDFGMIPDELARELGITNCELHQLDEEWMPGTFTPLLSHNG
jgi:hypothetical protein